MSEEHRSVVIQQVKNHRFATMVIGSIIVSLGLVYVALSLYSSSGTAQLDLSRPGLEEIRKQAANDDGSYRGFSSTGTLNDKSYEEFKKLYSEKLEEAQSLDAFGGDALSPKSLQIDQDSVLQTMANP
ncbi:MAG: hypothetical protein ACSLEY_03000 [Candidatus Saccharimonadales bacterium]